MPHSQLHPLEIDPNTGEPFLRLPAPRTNIIITPPRPTDVPGLVALYNDPELAQWLNSIPHPFLEEHAEPRLARMIASSEVVMKEIQAAEAAFPEGPLQFIGGCPVTALREVKPDGTQVYIGDVKVRRCLFVHLGLEEPERLQVMEANDARPVGDESIVWGMADALAKSHHGQGIMTAAIGTVIRDWMIPRMNARHIRAETFVGNIGSVRVFEKNGFVAESPAVKIDWVSASGIRHAGLHCLAWEFDAQEKRHLD
ncbi:hypothetical protein EIP91_002303 [Steccherinum ochraceum]|uniref:N-acetyltransferase domain-containing protein n=1 Tax=Steccherinum ochraceum TaxID=92696 RepID=A0A4R0RET4_9APHY|nr:hypothetical protein EIP91_002303 [Steccherinum ochraceum]